MLCSFLLFFFLFLASFFRSSTFDFRLSLTFASNSEKAKTTLQVINFCISAAGDYPIFEGRDFYYIARSLSLPSPQVKYIFIIFRSKNKYTGSCKVIGKYSTQHLLDLTIKLTLFISLRLYGIFWSCYLWGF